MSKEAMKLALEALENSWTEPGNKQYEFEKETITALKALAEQPAQQKPVTPCTHPSLGACSLREDGTASRWNCVMCGTEFVPKATNRWAEFNEATKRNMEHAEWYLSTHPQPAQQALDKMAENARELGLDYEPAQQEPVAYWIPKAEQFCIADPSGRPFAKAWEPLYTSPPAQRKPLTDEEIIKCWGQVSGTRYGYAAFARAIEAAHGIKENT